MPKTVMVLGGGFAGVQAAIELQRQKRFRVVLVSDRDYLFLFPTSIWIPTHGITMDQARVSLEDIRRAHGFDVVVDRVTEIRAAESRVITASHDLGYDYLVVAVGAGKTALDGQEHTLSICGQPEVSLDIRDRLDALIARGSGSIAVGFGGNPKDKSAVRGGPAFEFLFNVERHLRRKGVRDRFTLTFFAPMESPGERMGARAVAMVDRMFDQLGIAKRYGKKISRFRPEGVVFEDQSTLDADLVMFIPGNAGHPVLMHSDLPLSDAGFVTVDDHCLVAGTNSVYAVGDAAALEGPDWKAKQGHLAEVMARVAVTNIGRTEDGIAEREGYRRHLSILCLMDTGNGAALVFRDATRQAVIPLPVVGHWMKRGWGLYARWTKTGKVPRIPGL